MRSLQGSRNSTRFRNSKRRPSWENSSKAGSRKLFEEHGGAGRTADLLLPLFARQALRGGIRSPFSTEFP